MENFHTASPSLGFTEAVKKASGSLLVFNGRSRRSELWWWMALVFITEQIVTSFTSNLWVNAIVSIIIMFFGLAVTVRRVQDTGKNALWVYASYALGSVLQLLIAGSEVMNKLMHMVATSGRMDEKVVTRLVENNIGEMGLIGTASLLWCILSLVVIIFCLLDSDAAANKYGDSPKYSYTEA